MTKKLYNKDDAKRYSKIQHANPIDGIALAKLMTEEPAKYLQWLNDDMAQIKKDAKEEALNEAIHPVWGKDTLTITIPIGIDKRNGLTDSGKGYQLSEFLRYGKTLVEPKTGRKLFTRLHITETMTKEERAAHEKALSDAKKA